MLKAVFFDIDGTLLEFGTRNMPSSTLYALNALRSKGVKLFVATGRTNLLKAVFFDIDGTLLEFGTRNMPSSTLYALNALRSKGVKLFVATGRTPIDTEFIKDFFKFDGYIASNGQYCMVDDEILYEQLLDTDDLNILARRVYDMDIPSFFSTRNETRCNVLDSRAIAIHDTAGIIIPRICTLEEAVSGGVYQMMIVVSEEQERELLQGTKNVVVTRWSGDFLDIIPANGGKHLGLDSIIKKYGIDRSEVLAFGDGENDRTMIQHAGVGVAMGTSPKMLMDVADYVTDAAEDNGIYNFLTKNGYIE